MQHLELEKPVELEDWKGVLSASGSAISFQDHASTFGEQQALRISAELKTIVDNFGGVALGAVFAVRNGTIEGLWLDPLHNYWAVEFSRAKGDEQDVVITLSFMQSGD